MNRYKLTSKNQATIPKEVREVLDLKTGDAIYFNILKNGRVAIGKVVALEESSYDEIRHVFTEWNSKEDDETFASLQKYAR